VAALPAPRHEKVEIDAEIQDRLESLGYTE
jgi:hypothetical protein